MTEVGRLRIAYPCSFEADKICSGYYGDGNGTDTQIRAHAIKETLAAIFGSEGRLHWMTMDIPFGTKVTEEEPELTPIERTSHVEDLGEAYEGIVWDPPNPLRKTKKARKFFDRYLVIDLKIPSVSFKKKGIKRVFMDLSDDEDSI